MSGPPAATYRLQLGPGLSFAGALALVPYLDALGVSDLYLSPVLRARRGSGHGYDVVDPTRVSPELGGEEGLRALAAEVRRRGMGLVLDIVPNHMAASEENPWWEDLLRWGRAAPGAARFDVDWSPPRGELKGRVLLPILAERYPEALAAGRLSLALDEGGLRVAYGDRRLPLNPRSYPQVLRPGKTGPLAGLARALAALRPGDEAARRRLERRLWRLYRADAAVRAHVDGRLRKYRGAPAAGRLDRLLATQAYRLAYWQVADQEVNYRRFFAVSELAALRAEDEAVFSATHAATLRLVEALPARGLRVDHIDGLADPLAYLRRLAESCHARILVEKILAPGEDLPPDWPVAGTTGYDFLSLANGLFVDPEGVDRLRRDYLRRYGGARDFGALVRDLKRHAAARLFAGEFRALARRLGRLAGHDRAGRDLTLAELEAALVEVTVRLDVYRTYVRGEEIAPLDRETIERALAGARGSASPAALDFLRRVLTLERHDPSWLRFVVRWQQFTGPVMAKGFEDCALYRHVPLASLNEVGGDPAARGTRVADFHAAMRRRLETSPDTMNATSTHDTKRGEDVRLRIDALSELSGRWLDAVDGWRRSRDALRRRTGRQSVPDAGTEWLLYQTLAGAWPLDADGAAGFAERLSAHMLKAVREAGAFTSWNEPDPAYEEALLAFVDGLLADAAFLAEFGAIQRPVAFCAALSSLAQVVLKTAAPGVPDLYQGSELWDLNLTDPDNRRPVDFARRASLLAEMDARAGEDPAGLARDLLARWPDGTVKLYVTSRALRLRRAWRELFARGAYLPVEVDGPRRGHLCAFLRHHRGAWALAVAPRLLAGLLAGEDGLPAERIPAGLWDGTDLLLPPGAPRHWRLALTGGDAAAGADGRLSVGPLLADLPVALAVADGEGSAAGGEGPAAWDEGPIAQDEAPTAQGEAPDHPGRGPDRPG